MSEEALFEEGSRIVEEADCLLICAGAGMGVDSGLPDFRGDKGFWRAYPAAEKLGLSFVDLADPKWFDDDPELAWAFYGHRLRLYRDTVPHEGFSMLLEFAKSKRDRFVFTSNVDGQFQKAGFDEERIMECHGSIHYLQCTRCDAGIWSAEGVEVSVDMQSFRACDPPICPDCGAVARPNILMFGDWGWDAGRTDDQKRRFDNFLRGVEERGDSLSVIEIGAGNAVPTVRMTSERIASALGAEIVRINPREPRIDPSLGLGIAVGGLEGIERLIGKR